MTVYGFKLMRTEGSETAELDRGWDVEGMKDSLSAAVDKDIERYAGEGIEARYVPGDLSSAIMQGNAEDSPLVRYDFVEFDMR